MISSLQLSAKLESNFIGKLLFSLSISPQTSFPYPYTRDLKCRAGSE